MTPARLEELKALFNLPDPLRLNELPTMRQIVVGGRELIAEVERHERYLAEIVQDRLDEMNAEAETFDRDATNALRFLLKQCGEAGNDLINDADGWSPDLAVETIMKEFRRAAVNILPGTDRDAPIARAEGCD